MSRTSESVHLWPVAATAEGNPPSIWNGLIRHPWRLLALLCLTQIACWTVMPALVNVGPPYDVVEGFMWGREWVLLTYKHPQLPCWLLEISHLLTGSFRWPQYMLSQLLISTTFILVYLLARDIMGSTRALAAVLLMPSIYFFGWPTPQFNHDYAQMPFWAGISWLLWRAARDGRPGWWLALGVVSGLGLYAKFSTALLLVFGGIWLLYDSRARNRLATQWPWLGLAVFLGIAAPLAVELFRLDFLPLTYAAHRNEWVLAHRARLYYIGVQLAGLSAVPVVLALSGLLRRRASPAQEPLQPQPAPERRAIIYLAWMGLGPALLIMIASLFTGTGESWGATMYNLVGVLAIAFLGHRLGATELRRLTVLALLCVVAVSSAYAVTRWTGCNVRGRLQPMCWPAQSISRTAEAIWHEAVPGPLGIVGGEDGVARLAGLEAADQPSIFTALDRRLAPWITDQRLRDQGMLLVWPKGWPLTPQQLAWTDGLSVKTVSFDWSLRAPPLEINFAVIPPGRSSFPGDPPGPPDPE
ncbi:MAG: glycosyltransferase family 39 protein [Mesorhizobium sp.]|uniref:ArnT family glycosyltransferase n=1 Tax=Mesorhizobium sp. TaxID=1871066 RepID=UPI000FE6FFC3|nr:glycosyltransferase family 39 protein [Mesorhizobium sp.]RWE81858.1 MAG: glycosyltransferase family 39 protein [Mesorhizobium sp.]TIT13874.1 MAG: glycosyltransferase family 39 protein [Mesorhizobium sp.]TJW62891.1 MAG: glycosyltransferase family 39 protein [Mesorhizobium sp.]